MTRRCVPLALLALLALLPPTRALQLGSSRAAQWDQFKTHHVGAWRGLWETFDHLGDVVDRTETLFDVALDPTGDGATLAQTLPVAVTQADCETCFDSQDERRIPMGRVGADSGLGRSTVLGPVLVNGPVVLRSGAMATEIGVRHKHGRARVTFQHAPVWHKDSEPGVGLPDALELYRVVFRREVLRDFCPTPENEAAKDDVLFWRGVPPFKWAEDGDQWTGETSSHAANGDQVAPSPLSLADEDSRWHERFRGEDPDNTWHLRLPGGLLMQCPRRIFRSSADEADAGGLPQFRLAWLCGEDTLLRTTVCVRALEEVAEDEGAFVVLPPALETIEFDELHKPIAVE